MKKLMTVMMAATLMAASLAWAQEPPRMKMTGEVPPGIATPDKIMTRFGDLNFFDGVPDKETREKVYNHLDFQHGFQAFMGGIQIASMDALRKGILEFGPANTTPFLFSADETADVGTDGATPVTEGMPPVLRRIGQSSAHFLKEA